MCDLVCDPPDHHYLFSRDVSFLLLLWHHVPPSSTSPTAFDDACNLATPVHIRSHNPPPPLDEAPAALLHLFVLPSVVLLLSLELVTATHPTQESCHYRQH
jgi:hypothetical protein